MTAENILGIILAVLVSINLGLLFHIYRRDKELDRREDVVSDREFRCTSDEERQKFTEKCLNRMKEGLNRREKALAEKEKLFSRLQPEEQWERFKNALADICAGVYQVPASILRGGLSKEQEAAFYRNFNIPKGNVDTSGGAKSGPICLCTAKVEPGDGILDCAIYCDLHKDALESIPGYNGAVRHQANEIASAFLSFISELWENGNHTKEVSLYVVFTEDQHET